MRVDHRRLGDVDLGEAGSKHVLRQQVIFGVGDVAERHLLPRGPRDTAVGVGEEPEAAEEHARQQPVSSAGSSVSIVENRSAENDQTRS